MFTTPPGMSLVAITWPEGRKISQLLGWKFENFTVKFKSRNLKQKNPQTAAKILKMMQMKKEYFIATWQRSAATRGNLSLGSITTVFPAAIAGPRREHSPNIGHWAGAVIPTTPTGSFCSQGEEQNLSAQAAAMNSRCSDVSTWSRWRLELELVKEWESSEY